MNDCKFHGKINIENLQQFAIKEFRNIREVVNKSNSKIVGILLSTDKYKHLGILRGDLLITKLETDLSRISNHSLCIVQNPKGRTVLFANEIFDEKLFGVVVRIERDLEAV